MYFYVNCDILDIVLKNFFCRKGLYKMLLHFYCQNEGRNFKSRLERISKIGKMELTRNCKFYKSFSYQNINFSIHFLEELDVLRKEEMFILLKKSITKNVSGGIQVPRVFVQKQKVGYDFFLGVCTVLYTSFEEVNDIVVQTVPEEQKFIISIM